MQVDDISTIAIVGSGLMGHGIAQEFARAGFNVCMNDVSEEKLNLALKNIGANLRMLIDIGTINQAQADSTLENISTYAELKEAVGAADLVIEAVLENLELKKDIFHQLDRYCPEHTILASNTSSLMPGMLASSTERPDRVLVTHYFNPPYLLPLVEIVRHKETSDETVSVVYDLLKKVGKSPAIVQKEVPGFVGNRLQMALFREALSIVEQGIATHEDVDIVVKNGFGRRYAAAGPFEIWGLAGWDLILSIAGYLLSDLTSSTETSPLLKSRVEAGELGAKAGKGFYKWTPATAEALRQKMSKMLVEIEKMTRPE